MKFYYKKSNEFRIGVYAILVLISSFLVEDFYYMIPWLAGLGFAICFTSSSTITCDMIRQRRFFLYSKKYFINDVEMVICNNVEKYTPNGNEHNPLIIILNNKQTVHIGDAFKNNAKSITKVVELLKYFESKGVKVYLYVPKAKKHLRIFKASFEEIDHLFEYNWTPF